MGQAKRRGTFEERKAQAIARRAELTDQYRKNMQGAAAELPESRQNPKTELPFRRKLGRSFAGIQMAAAIANMGAWGR